MMMIQFDNVRNLKDPVTNGLVDCGMSKPWNSSRCSGSGRGSTAVGLHATVKDATRMIV